jgi:hypothetical protein
MSATQVLFYALYPIPNLSAHTRCVMCFLMELPFKCLAKIAAVCSEMQILWLLGRCSYITLYVLYSNAAIYYIPLYSG